MADAFTGDGEFLADFFEGSFSCLIEVEAFCDHFFFLFGKEEEEVLDDFVDFRKGFNHRSRTAAKHKNES